MSKLTCSDLIQIRESHFTAQSLRVLFQDISPEKIFLKNFLKEINVWKKLKLRSFLVMFVPYLLSMFLKLYIYQF